MKLEKGKSKVEAILHYKENPKKTDCQEGGQSEVTRIKKTTEDFYTQQTPCDIKGKSKQVR